MSDSNQPQSIPNPTLEGLLAPYFAEYHREKCYPGLTLYQGNRRMVQINVPAHDLPTLLQAKPSKDNDPDSGKNRPEVPGHVEEIKEYLRDRIKKGKPWILGTLTANVDPDKIQLIEFARGICLVIIPRGTKLDITDGQHRKRAIHELIESSEGEGELIANHDFPITLVLENKFEQCQTDFRDMADTKPLPKTLVKSFGEFEGQVGIMKTLIKELVIFADKTEKN
ncbi:DNA sulfur modification protein DndB [[Phormidium] sp. ETS-05]|uniref:DNA sulfur modification protein DndB n=1 Tax=[Phormidium] sp. ETS-05 TaxID=222819 RepID=UPI0031FE5584